LRRYLPSSGPVLLHIELTLISNCTHVRSCLLVLNVKILGE
jgi:hypothetical protein